MWAKFNLGTAWNKLPPQLCAPVERGQTDSIDCQRYVVWSN